MKMRRSLEAFTKVGEDVIKDIKFPVEEIPYLRHRNTIVTHRVSNDANKYAKGDYVYSEEVDGNYCFEVVDRTVIRNVEDSKYNKDLTEGRRRYLKKFNYIAVLTLKKTKYERPYKLSTIKSKYPSKVYKMLAADPCHSWRTRTGIDMIHLEPDAQEQTRTYKNWNLMPDKYKSVSDNKCRELFGTTNLEHYDIVKYEKDISDDAEFMAVKKGYLELFNFDLSRFRLISTRTPRYMNGYHANFPLNEFGGCYTTRGVVYINSNLKPVMKFYGVKCTEAELKVAILAHELAHAVYREYADKKFRDRILAKARSENFTTEYLKHVKPDKLAEETFCEYMASLTRGYIDD